MTVFNWLNEITVKKTSSTQFEKEDWDGWNSYMVHRFLSMNKDYLEIKLILFLEMGIMQIEFYLFEGAV